MKRFLHSAVVATLLVPPAAALASKALAAYRGVPLLSAKPDVPTQKIKGSECADKKSDFERAICEDPLAKAEDTAMNRTYFGTYKRLDGQRKTALLADQRAWLKARLKENLTGNTENFTPADQAIEYLSDRMMDIEANFPVEGYSGERDPRENKDREPVADVPTRPFEGSWPNFLRYQGSDVEVGLTLFQNGKRICGTKAAFFSGHIATTALVAQVEGQKARILFLCKMDGAGENCATNSLNDPLWQKSSGTFSLCSGKLVEGAQEVGNAAASGDNPCKGRGIRKAGFRRGEVEERDKWIGACLRDHDYPSPTARAPSDSRR